VILKYYISLSNAQSAVGQVEGLFAVSETIQISDAVEVRVALRGDRQAGALA
jgi:hypothetical protein